MNPGFRRLLQIAALFFGIFLAVRYVFPLVFPFLLGLLLALGAEPMVKFFCGKCRMRRALAAGLGVSMAFFLLTLAVLTLCGLIIRELSALAGILPELEEAVRAGMDALSGWVMGLAQRAPDGIRGLLTRNVTEVFSGGSALLDRVMDFLLRLASGFLSRVPGGALTLGTAIISSFMISAKLPAIRAFFRGRLPMEKLQPIFSTLRGLKSALLGWLKAQLKLSGVTFLIAAAGFLLLRVPYAPLWAVLVALVDAFPILGTGAVLIPWSIVSFVQGDHFRAFALLGLYGAAALTRSVLEPRLVGKQLGLDPLVTLMALYIGYQLFGFAGMLLSPMLAVTAVQLIGALRPSES